MIEAAPVGQRLELERGRVLGEQPANLAGDFAGHGRRVHETP